MLNIYWIFASAFAGLLTFLSPCVLPVLPLVLSTSLSRSKWRPFWIVTGLVLGFFILGITLNFLGSFLGISPQGVRWIAIAILFLAGVLFLFPELSSRLFQPLAHRFGKAQGSSEGVFGGLAIGASLGAVWTPCAGPIFAVVLSASLLQKSFWDSAILFLTYAVGAGLPMLAVAYLGNRLTARLRCIARVENQIRRAAGAILVLGATLFALGLDTRLLASLPVTWVNTAKVETKIVDSLQGPGMMESKIENGSLPILREAPEILGISHWLNSPPLTKEQLKGKVVLVDFWTYSCINCLRTLPYLRQWHQNYRDQGFVIVGIHAPEFAFEKDLGNVTKAVKDLDVSWPVGLDNDFATWRNYDNHYWPAHYLIDAHGKLRYYHHGEGEYERTEAAIQFLLKERGMPQQKIVSAQIQPLVDFSRVGSPETYLGFARMERFISPESVKANQVQSYTLPQEQPLNTWSLEGDWKVEAERSLNQSPQAKLRFKFKAQKLNLVMNSVSPVEAVVRIDGKVVDTKTAGQDIKEGKVRIDSPRLYELIDLKEIRGEHLFEIEFLSPGVEVFAFTFG